MFLSTLFPHLQHFRVDELSKTEQHIVLMCQSPKGHEGALGMVRHPQSLFTDHALLTQRRQAHFSLGGGTGFSSRHLLFPPSRFSFLVSSFCQDRLAILVFFLISELFQYTQGKGTGQIDDKL
jgi:hypothetical protein